MANVALNAQLQALRDEYTQRQKAASGTLAALKGKASLLAKIQKALDTYGISDGSATLDVVNQDTSRLRDSAAPFIDQTSKADKQFAGIAAVLKETIGALNTTPIDVVKLNAVLTKLRKLNISDERVSALLPALDEELNEAQQNLGIEFGMLLREGFATQGLTVNGGSPNDAPKFDVGRFEIAVDFRRRKAAINYGKELVVAGVALNVEAVSKAYQRAIKLISGRNEAPETWISQLYTAYKIAQKLQDSPNSRVNIVDCYVNLVLHVRQNKQFASAPSKNGLAEYTRAQFAYDFYEYAEHTQNAYNRQIVTAYAGIKAQTEQGSAKALWVVEGESPYAGRFIGDIEFTTRS